MAGILKIAMVLINTILPQLKDLNPSIVFLFGGSIKGLAWDIIASHRLDPFKRGYSCKRV